MSRPRSSSSEREPSVSRASSRSGRESPRVVRRSRSPTAEEGVVAALGIDPHQAGEIDEADVSTSSSSCSSTRPWSRSARSGSTTSTTVAPRDVQRALFDRQLEIASAAGLPVVIHTRDADGDTAAALSVVRRNRHPPLLLGSGPARHGARARLLRVVRRERDLSEGRSAAGGGGRRARRSDPRRDRQPVSRAAAAPRQAKRAGQRAPHARRPRGSAGSPESPRSRAQIDRNASVAFGLSRP